MLKGSRKRFGVILICELEVLVILKGSFHPLKSGGQRFLPCLEWSARGGGVCARSFRTRDFPIL